MSNGRPWSADDTASLRRMAGAGYSDAEIGEHLGRHPKLIAQKRRDHRIAAGLSPSLLTALRRLSVRRFAQAA